MPMEFADVQQANMRLARSIFRYKGLPVVLGDVEDDYSCRFRYLISNQADDIEDVRVAMRGPDPLLDIKPVPLGFCQVDEFARYITRMPRRRYKQGLNEESMMAEGGRLPSLDNNAFKKNLGKAIQGEYVTLKAALKMVNGDKFISVPFRRNWALMNRDEKIYVLFKYYGAVGELVGDQVVLSPNFRYLQETLDEEVGLA